MTIARDKFWLFGVRAHQDDIFLGKSTEKRNYRWSRITPGEAALMLDVPNMIMVNCDGIPVPFSCDAYGYAESFCRMKNVLWGVTGSGGFRIGNEEKFVCDLAEKYPYIGGAFMDDFFIKFKNDPDPNASAEALLSEIRSGLDKACRPMELYVTWYTHEIEGVDKKLLSYIDGITLWTWESKNLPNLTANFDIIEKNFKEQKKLLGIYMYDFTTGMPLTNEQMEFQCEFGLEMMKKGRLDGMIFETNSVMGVGLPSEMWLREWVERVKYTILPD
ncbi:MAG: hypothetical protein IJ428_06360 [Clostridia bacterium]|nr:hypothetical protein [Clostridia bacterium]